MYAIQAYLGFDPLTPLQILKLGVAPGRQASRTHGNQSPFLLDTNSEGIMVSRLKAIQSPDTWGTLSEDELLWCSQFSQTLDWEEYQEERKHYKPGMGASLMTYIAASNGNQQQYANQFNQPTQARYMWDGREITEAEHQMLVLAGINSAQPVSLPDPKARRDRIAEGFAYSLVQHYEINDRLTPNEERAQICRAAIFLADALIAELDRA